MKPLISKSDLPPRPPASRARRCVRVVVIIALGVAVMFTIRRLDGRALARAVGQARPSLLALAALLAVVQLACRGVVFRTLMLPVMRIPWFRSLRYALAGAAASSVAPGRAGDFLRMVLLKRDGNVPVSSTAAVMVVDKIVDIAAMFLVLLPAPWLLPDLPSWVGRSLLAAAGLAGVLLVSAFLIAKRAYPPRWFAAFHAGLGVVRRPSLLAWALLPALASWLLDFGCVVVMMRAVGIAAPAALGLLVLLAVNLAMTVPVMPANVGTFELAVLAVFTPLGVPTELSLAFGLLYHMAQVLPVVGLAFLDGRFIARSTSAD
jgi:glycosyltransferase 2 family protein